ncbi:uncharacterized protein LJ206_019045 isoform 4-T4 [Theristicus caerulescens]
MESGVRPGVPRTSVPAEAVPEAPWGEGWPLVTQGSGQVGGLSAAGLVACGQHGSLASGLLLCILALHLCVQDPLATAEHSAVTNASVAPSNASVAPSNASVAPSNASVAPNTSVNSTEETLLTCQSFQCSGERCYQDEAHANETVTCHNETYCESVSYFCSFVTASLHTPSIFPFGSAVAALSFLQHELHSPVQQRVWHRDVQDQQQHEHAAVCPGLLRLPALPAAQCQLLRGKCVQRSPVTGRDVSKARRLLLDALSGMTSVR